MPEQPCAVSVAVTGLYIMAFSSDIADVAPALAYPVATFSMSTFSCPSSGLPKAVVLIMPFPHMSTYCWLTETGIRSSFNPELAGTEAQCHIGCS